jgi:arginase
LRDEDSVVYGFRDEAEAFEHGSQPLPATILAISELTLRSKGFAPSIEKALAHLCRPDLKGFWLHLDVDVLAHQILPAADFPPSGGLQWNELKSILVAALRTGEVAGVEVTIFNANLDQDGAQAEELTAFLADVFEAARLTQIE